MFIHAFQKVYKIKQFISYKLNHKNLNFKTFSIQITPQLILGHTLLWNRKFNFLYPTHLNSLKYLQYNLNFQYRFYSKMPLIGAIDAGTTSTRFMLFDKDNITSPVQISQIKHSTYYPQPGFVEHDANELFENTLKCIDEAVLGMSNKEEIVCIGVTNQRETTVMWDSMTGEILGRSLVWNDVRTSHLVERLKKGNEVKWEKVRQKCGLNLATYFSGVKIRWLIENDAMVQNAIKNDRAMFGTVDSWLIWKLTGGINGGVHVTDVTNASRTMLMNLETLQWDKFLFEALDIPYGKGIKFPEIKSSAEFYGTITVGSLKGVAISGCIGDQQAALVGQRCFNSGETKCTYGTGCFMVMNTGNNIVHSTHGLVTTVGYKFGEQDTCYALEGSVANAGASIEWAKNNIGLIKKFNEIENLITSVEDSGDVYFVPAFSGLFAPHWRSDARGTIVGMTLYTKREHIIRALIESICYQNNDVLESMKKDANIDVKVMKVDGGITKNNAILQIQSDIFGTKILRPTFTELTALGAAISAGIGSKIWNNTQDIKIEDKVFEFDPKINAQKRESGLKKWHKAIEKSLSWTEEL